MLVFSISEQSSCSNKARKLVFVPFFSDGNGEKVGGVGWRKSNDGIAVYSAEATGLYSIKLPCRAQSAVQHSLKILLIICSILAS